MHVPLVVSLSGSIRGKTPNALAIQERLSEI